MSRTINLMIRDDGVATIYDDTYDITIHCENEEEQHKVVELLKSIPSAQPTLCGYDIEHLMLIANVLRKENLSPERVTDALTDIGRIVSMVIDEFEETLRKAVEQCKI